LQTHQVQSTITSIKTDELKPIGQKYFQYRESDQFNYIYPWLDLVQLDNLSEPVCILPLQTYLYSVDWSSSLIIKLADCAFIKVKSNCEIIELLDSKLHLIMELNVRTLFDNYKPIEPVEYDDEQDHLNTESNNLLNITITVNNNILLYFEYRNLIDDHRGKVIVMPGVTNCYGWDFTSNTQVKFNNMELYHYISDVIPFRNLDNSNKIKYIAYEWYPAGSWCRTYESQQN
jgi:hypothetical protein